MFSIETSIRLLPTTTAKIDLFEFGRTLLLSGKAEGWLQKIFNQIANEMQQSSFKNYSNTIFFTPSVTLLEFENLRSIALSQLGEWLTNNSAPSYGLLNIFFYAVIHRDYEIYDSCFMHPAYKISNETLYSILNKSRDAGSFFSDDFLFTNTKVISIYKPGQDVYESFFLDKIQAKKFKESLSSFLYSNEGETILNKIINENIFLPDLDNELIIQRQL